MSLYNTTKAPTPVEFTDTERVELILNLIVNGEPGTYFIDQILAQAGETERYSYIRIMEILKVENLADTFDNARVAPNYNTRKIVENGGYRKHLERNAIKQLRLKKREDLEINNLEIQVKLNTYLLKTKWLPHIVAFISLGISIFALIKSYN